MLARDSSALKVDEATFPKAAFRKAAALSGMAEEWKREKLKTCYRLKPGDSSPPGAWRRKKVGCITQQRGRLWVRLPGDMTSAHGLPPQCLPHLPFATWQMEWAALKPGELKTEPHQWQGLSWRFGTNNSWGDRQPRKPMPKMEMIFPPSTWPTRGTTDLPGVTS